jgi:hypothetical protein
MHSVPVATAVPSPGAPLPTRRGPSHGRPSRGGPVQGRELPSRPVSPGVEAAAFTRFALAEAATVAGLLAVLATAFVV